MPPASSIPRKLPASVPAAFADMLMSPSTVVRLEPDAIPIDWTAVNIAAPLPARVTSDGPVLNLIDVASAVRFLSAAKVMAPAAVNWSNGATSLPIVKPAAERRFVPPASKFSIRPLWASK